MGGEFGVSIRNGWMCVWCGWVIMCKVCCCVNCCWGGC